ncbi:hypothetical protein PPERSA_11658 [Pseudocohnilembus persalinus]|uniref:Uncharacterized protein n=1 Tax=Pseudocohnilembus persalinus TaxID=266149 RepID=A0A0V0QA49_PSEPJ|nr:hypothetical protein PPERSA_11658 [Pseudocohnilembus persalinus]|eukprot:KRW99057.1 hypothetical protein PPERSA_11658 [Pseudocohnilembus persalinus]
MLMMFSYSKIEIKQIESNKNQSATFKHNYKEIKTLNEKIQNYNELIQFYEKELENKNSKILNLIQNKKKQDKVISQHQLVQQKIRDKLQIQDQKLVDQINIYKQELEQRVKKISNLNKQLKMQNEIVENLNTKLLQKDEDKNNLKKEIEQEYLKLSNSLKIQKKDKEIEAKNIQIKDLEAKLEKYKIQILKQSTQLNNLQKEIQNFYLQKQQNDNKISEKANEQEDPQTQILKNIMKLLQTAQKTASITPDTLKNHVFYFEKSKNHYKSQQIKISKDSKSLKFPKKKSQKTKENNIYQVYSHLLNKEKSYHIQVKINLYGKKKQDVSFALVEDQFKDQNFSFYSQNSIFISNFNGHYGASYNYKGTFLGPQFSEFMQDDVTIFNIVFNFSQKLFYVFDGDNKTVVSYNVDDTKIQNLRFGMGFMDHQGSEALFTIEQFREI